VSAWRKLGVIAGGGDLPVVLAEHCATTGLPYFVARVAPYADARLDAHPGATRSLGAMGTRMRDLKDEGCDAVVLIGQVLRQDPRGLELDEGGLAMAPDILAAAPKGDDALLRVLVEHHEKAGFRVIGVEEAMADLLATPGPWGAHAPTDRQRKDIAKAARIAAALGAYDVGQGVVVCDGLPLAVEAQEGTDRMLARVADLPLDVRGSATARKGVLVKRPKPIQERRIDLPTIGVRTIEGAAAAGLAGIAVEAGGALAVRRAEIVAAADRLGLFVYGFPPAEVDGA
jgi:hypothetical protein